MGRHVDQSEANWWRNARFVELQALLAAIVAVGLLIYFRPLLNSLFSGIAFGDLALIVLIPLILAAICNASIAVRRSVDEQFDVADDR